MGRINIEFDYITPETHDMILYFDCGDDGLNRYLKEKAYQDEKNNLITVHLAIDTDREKIIGYYALKNTSLLYTVDKKGIRGIPSTEIYMFAIDKDYQGKKYNRKNFSSFILDNAINKITNCSEEISASRFIIVNSLKRSLNFYKIYNKFEEFEPYMSYLNDDASINIDDKHLLYRRIYVN